MPNKNRLIRIKDFGDEPVFVARDVENRQHHIANLHPVRVGVNSPDLGKVFPPRRFGGPKPRIKLYISVPEPLSSFEQLLTRNDVHFQGDVTFGSYTPPRR